MVVIEEMTKEELVRLAKKLLQENRDIQRELHRAIQHPGDYRGSTMAYMFPTWLQEYEKETE